MNRFILPTACLAIAVGYAISHATSTAMLEGQANGLLFSRNLVGQIMGSASLWISCAFLAGKSISGRTLLSSFVGVFTLLFMLAVHYATGALLGFFSSSIFSDNQIWFLASLPAGMIFGLLGYLSNRIPLLSLILALCFLTEPFVIGYIPGLKSLPWTTVLAGQIAGIFLICVGILIVYIACKEAIKGGRNG